MHNILLRFVVLACFTGAVGDLAGQELIAEKPKDVQEEKNQLALEKFISSHRSEISLLRQSELDGLVDSQGGGACPTAAAINTYQMIRLLAGKELDSNLYKVAIEIFTADPSLLRGRLSNRQFSGVLNLLSRRCEEVELSVSILSAPNSPYAISGKRWSNNDALDPSCKGDRISMLSFTVEQDGEVLGRHFVTVVRRIGDELLVIDPNSPTKLHRYRIERRLDIGDRLFLRYPLGLDKGRSLEVNTIFEITFRGLRIGSGRIPTESTSVASVLTEIDALASKLASQGELRSPKKWRAEGARFGLPALDLPSEFGGANWPASKMIQVFRHAGRFDLNLRDVVGGAHARVLLHCKSVESRDILQRLADGEGYMAITITEKGSGSDFTAMESTSEKVDGGYILNGKKRFNARLEQASHVLVFTRSNSGRIGRLNVFAVPMDAKGLKVESFGAHGLVGNSYGGLELDNVFVPDALRVGDEDEGYDIFNSHFRYWRLMQAAAAIGTAERALEMMAERLETRKVYGAPIGRFTHLQQPLGQHSTELKMAWALAIEAAKLIDERRFAEADELVCGLKAEGVEIALKAVDAAARAFGGEGYSDLVDIGDRLRDLNGLRIADGTTDVMRSAVVKSRFGKQFWEMAFKPQSTKAETKE